ncbi:MAG: DNA recombination protein RmuC [Euryarchaeota archaeon]|nr:DNA recombination protein RmuC [Euryarchaeota archaeon]|tara:strand:+ start:9478 stop:10680 length:1203 start_codon:yes stop_codon:yes gene_type:complete
MYSRRIDIGMVSVELVIILILSLALIASIWKLLAGDSGSNDIELRRELREMNKLSTETLTTTLRDIGIEQQKHLANVSININELKEGNEKKLDQMRDTVDEKLQSTLEKRISESFKLVSDRLEAVQKGLGEMQTLAMDVGGLKKVLSNVSTRGALGEIQAEQILQSILSPNQYEKNVKTHPACKGQVEFAIKLPGIGGDYTKPVWLPIDCKFPKEDYLRLQEAMDEGDKKAIQDAYKKFESNVKGKAKTISQEYVASPYTTDFAVMFLPTEGLYADVVRRPGLFETLQRDHQIVVTGPSTLAAFVNSLQMGFRTLALESSASEVWNVLGGVKTEFVKFGNRMTKLHKQLNTAANTISNERGEDSMMRRLRAMEKKLKDVQSLPASSSAAVLGLPENIVDE